MHGRTARTNEAARTPGDPLTETLLRAGRGDEDAFAEVYDAVAPCVHGLVLRVIGDPHQAHEVVQEVFLEIWRQSARFDPGEGSALGWLMGVAHLRAVHRVRSRPSARRRDDPWHETGEDAHQSRSLGAALASLPAAQRQAVELAYFGAHTHVDVSRLMQVPSSTTRTQIRTALLRLRQQPESASVGTS